MGRKIELTLDIETIPGQDKLAGLVAEELETFKAPSSLSKGQACEDLGLSEAEAKALSKDAAVDLWTAKFATEASQVRAEEKWLKTALNGGEGEVITAAFAIDDEEPVGFKRELDGLEFALLDDLFLAIGQEITKRQQAGWDVLWIGHNVKFDLQFLFQRAVIRGARPSFDLPFNGRHGVQFFDNMFAWCGYGQYIKQDKLCELLGEPVGHDMDGSKVWDRVKAGDIDSVLGYNIDDVKRARRNFNRLNFRTA